MTAASGLRVGGIVRLEKDFYKVLEAVLHSGGGKMGSMVHAKLRNLGTGHVAERRWAPDEKVDDVPVERAKMQFLYAEGDSCHFMNPETYDQMPIGKNTIGPAARFLKENDLIEVEFYEGKALSVHYPAVVEVSVASTGVGLRQSDSTYKEADLENGMEILVPQFVETGDRIHVEVETGKYVDRVHEKGKK